MKHNDHRVLLCSVLLACNVLGLQAQSQRTGATIRRVSIVGAATVGAGQVRDWLALKGTRFDMKLIEERSLLALRRLQDRGLIFAQFDSVQHSYSPDSSAVELTFFLEEGARPQVGEFRIIGLDSLGGQPPLKFRTRIGQHFDSANLESDIELLLRAFESSGYPFCAIQVKRLEFTGEGLAVELEVSPGPKVVVGEIEVVGNQQTRERVVLRELPFRAGALYNESQVRKIRPALLKLGFFKWVNPPRIEMREDGLGRLVIEVAEGNQNRFDGILGYNPASAATDAFVSGLLDIRLGNLFGTGRQAAAHWERRTKETQAFRVLYTEPWIGGQPVSGSFGFRQLIQDTSYVEREIELNAELRLNQRLFLSAGVSSRSISPDSLGALRLGVVPSTSFDLRTGFTFDTVDEPLNPSRGVKYQTSFQWSRKNIEGISGDATFNQKRISIDFEHYFSLFRWQVVAIALHGREITTGEDVVSLVDQYRFGGTRTLRGYREEQFRGSRIAWSNMEYRFLLGPRSRFFAFFDVGYFFREQRHSELGKQVVDSAKLGYGVGLRLQTRLGLVGIDYGLGEGDSFSNGKVHIGLTNEF